MSKNVLLFLFFYCSSSIVYSQPGGNADSTDSAKPKKRSPVKIFSGTRIINGSSVTNLPDGTLDFRISHRFGRLSDGSQNFYGLDNATTRIGLDYGITKWLMVGIGHNTFNKEDDGFMKIKLLNQKHNASPVAVSYYGAISDQTTPAPTLPNGDKWLLGYRLYYAHQLLIARKFCERFSLQIMPTIVHYNVVENSKNSNNTIAIGAGGRVKISKRIALTGEYYYRVTNADMQYNGAITYNSASVGMEIVSGGHVFQLMVTNSQGLTERTFIGQTTDNWGKGELHFGFNISRVFAIVKSKEPKS